jgi:hypothetical protein
MLGLALLLIGTTAPAAADNASDEQLAAEVRHAMRRFQERDSTLKADQGAAAKAKYADGIAICILPTAGLMAEASVGGQKLKFAPLKE